MVTIVALVAIDGADLNLGEAVADAQGNFTLEIAAETFKYVEQGTYTVQATGDAGSSASVELTKFKLE